MTVKTLMLFRGTGRIEKDNVACFTISCDHIIDEEDMLIIVGTDGKTCAKVHLENGIQIRVVGVGEQE